MFHQKMDGISLCGLPPGKEIPPLKLLLMMLMAEIMQQIIIGSFSHDLRWLFSPPRVVFPPPTETPSPATAREDHSVHCFGPQNHPKPHGFFQSRFQDYINIFI